MYLEKSEVVGSELPVIFEKSNAQFTYEELIYIGENPSEYEHIGFFPVYINDKQLFAKLYEKGE
ncbi:hypothetical protein [Bacillus subtilis]|uniref:hypothetical protein n=1 Tax=Bacillus subtilis TaxID=1423 RepID=UPI001B97B881|nr:hypothetical protein [Bacillus subtilis]CAI6330594.1 hypothetical protein NRS6096_21865 [Bacillus subtilis]